MEGSAYYRSASGELPVGAAEKDEKVEQAQEPEAEAEVEAEAEAADPEVGEDADAPPGDLDEVSRLKTLELATLLGEQLKETQYKSLPNRMELMRKTLKHTFEIRSVRFDEPCDVEVLAAKKQRICDIADDLFSMVTELSASGNVDSDANAPDAAAAEEEKAEESEAEKAEDPADPEGDSEEEELDADVELVGHQHAEPHKEASAAASSSTAAAVEALQDDSQASEDESSDDDSESRSDEMLGEERHAKRVKADPYEAAGDPSRWSWRPDGPARSPTAQEDDPRARQAVLSGAEAARHRERSEDEISSESNFSEDPERDFDESRRESSFREVSYRDDSRRDDSQDSRLGYRSSRREDKYRQPEPSPPASTAVQRLAALAEQRRQARREMEERGHASSRSPPGQRPHSRSASRASRTPPPPSLSPPPPSRSHGDRGRQQHNAPASICGVRRLAGVNHGDGNQDDQYDRRDRDALQNPRGSRRGAKDSWEDEGHEAWSERGSRDSGFNLRSRSRSRSRQRERDWNGHSQGRDEWGEWEWPREEQSRRSSKRSLQVHPALERAGLKLEMVCGNIPLLLLEDGSVFDNCASWLLQTITESTSKAASLYALSKDKKIEKECTKRGYRPELLWIAHMNRGQLSGIRAAAVSKRSVMLSLVIALIQQRKGMHLDRLFADVRKYDEKVEGPLRSLVEIAMSMVR